MESLAFSQNRCVTSRQRSRGNQVRTSTLMFRKAMNKTNRNLRNDWAEMNRTQLIILWIGIAIFVLMGLFPPRSHSRRIIQQIQGISGDDSPEPPRGGFILSDRRAIDWEMLSIGWAIVAVITGGLIYSLKVDPELILKISCAFLYLLCLDRRPGKKRSYAEILENARSKKTGTWIWIFWILLLLLSLV